MKKWVWAWIQTQAKLSHTPVSTRAPALALLVSSSLPSPRRVNQNLNGLQTTQPRVFVIISSVSRKQRWNSPNKTGNQTLNSNFKFAVRKTSPPVSSHSDFIRNLQTVLGIQTRFKKLGGGE